MNQIVTIDHPLTDPLMQELLEETGGTSIGEKSFQDIYKDLCIHKDIIYVINAEDEQKLRKGLSQVKSKYTAKLKDAQLHEEPQILEFIVHPASELHPLPKGQLKIQIVLKTVERVTVHQVIIPTGL